MLRAEEVQRAPATTSRGRAATPDLTSCATTPGGASAAHNRAGPDQDALGATLARAVAQRLDRAPPATALLQRTLRVTAIDYDPVAQRPIYGELDVAKFLVSLKDGAFEQELTETQKARLRGIDAANLSDVDIPSLAERILDHVVVLTTQSNPPTRGKAKREYDKAIADAQNRRATLLGKYRNALEGALVISAEDEVSDKEASAFKTLIAASNAAGAPLSRRKGVASDVPLTGLPAEMEASLNKLFTRLTQRNTALAAAASNTAYSKMTPGTLASWRLPVRSPHQNGAGWLQVHSAADPLPGLDAAALGWVQGRVANPLSTGHAALAAQFGNPPANVTARAIEESATLDQATKLEYYRDVLLVAGTPRARAQFAWRRYADHPVAGCPYIEFTAEDAKGISRIVWDYVQDRFYIGVHYNWFQGYSPFFRVVGAPATF